MYMHNKFNVTGRNRSTYETRNGEVLHFPIGLYLAKVRYVPAHRTTATHVVYDVVILHLLTVRGVGSGHIAQQQRMRSMTL